MKTSYVTMADSKSHDWLIALVNSLTVHQPDASLTVIPFDDKARDLEVLTKDFPLHFWFPPELSELDGLGEHLGAGRCHPSYYRKFAAFLLPTDTIVYIDTDIVINVPLKTYAEQMFAGGYDFIFQEINLLMACYPGPERDTLVKEHGFAGFNSGFFMCRGGLLDLPRLWELAPEARRLSHCLEWLDQGYMNLYAALRGWHMAPLWQLDHSLAKDNWAAFSYTRTPSGYRVETGEVNYECRVIPMLHWAGACKDERKQRPNLAWFLRYRYLHLPRWLRRPARLWWKIADSLKRHWIMHRRSFAGWTRHLIGDSPVDSLKRLLRA
ncbi:MAG TPA: hypothetical protein VIT21_06770 [Chthoniobacterales bacterium]